ncbi:MAG: NAD(P)/FAD-dependent oxidoreductase, partial [Planctomycetota bacterium]
MNPIRRYVDWLHTRWPAGTVEKLPAVNEDGSTNVSGLYVVGDLTGIPLLKFSSDTGARSVQTMLADPTFIKRDTTADDVMDVVVIGAGVSGLAACHEARKAGLRTTLIEASQPFDTVSNFPKGKPIYTYPTEMTPAGDLQFTEKSATKEGLVDELRDFMRTNGIEPTIARVEKVTKSGGIFDIHIAGGDTIRAHRVIVGIGRSGNFRKLGVPGEDQEKVFNRLHDPKDFRNKHCLVVGGGDSALETAIALAECGAFVTVSYRKPEFSRPKPDNVEALSRLADDPFANVSVEEPSSERVTTAVGGYMDDYRRAGSIRLMMASKPKDIRDDEVIVTN